VVTTFKPGQTITVQWIETVYHPGHYRIAFTIDRATLQDPMVMVDQNQISVSAAIQNPPMAPVLFDNLFPRTGPGAAGTMFKQDVVLPNITCAKCTLQVIQFMAGHGPPNYIYHHCADIQLGDAVSPADLGSISSDDGGGCALARSSPSRNCGVAALFLLSMFIRNRLRASASRIGRSR
jgi:hypothetical protein